MKEWTRKKLVYIKRNPQVFPKFMLLITCVFFTFNLTTYSFAAVDISNTMPAINLFIITLCSFMMVISFVPMRSSLIKKPISAGITLAILLLQVVLQFSYLSIMRTEIDALTAEQLLNHASWEKSVAITWVHIVLLFLSLAALLCMPLYAKALQKLKTSPPIDEDETVIDGDILQDEEDLEELARLDG